MEPIPIPAGPFASNMRAVLPGGTEDNDLPCRHIVTETGEGSVSTVQSVWILDGEDLEAISEDPANARIVLTLVCEADDIPPMGLAIENIPLPKEDPTTNGTSGPGFPD